jgi:hypothetical protein
MSRCRNGYRSAIRSNCKGVLLCQEKSKLLKRKVCAFVENSLRIFTSELHKTGKPQKSASNGALPKPSWEEGKMNKL